MKSFFLLFFFRVFFILSRLFSFMSERILDWISDRILDQISDWISDRISDWIFRTGFWTGYFGLDISDQIFRTGYFGPDISDQIFRTGFWTRFRTRCASPSNSLISLSYSVAAICANSFRLFLKIKPRRTLVISMSVAGKLILDLQQATTDLHFYRTRLLILH